MKNEKIKKYLHKKIKGFQPISQYNEVVSIKTMIASITAMVEKTGKVNFDFSDVKSILDNAIEISFFSGTEKDIATISCPEVDGVLLSIEGPKTLSLDKCRNIVNKFSKIE